MKNSKLSKYKIKKILKCFSEDLPASKTSKLLNINRNTINRYFNIFRLLLIHALETENIKISGSIELDESYFGAKRVRGKRGRGAAGKTPVFGLLQRDGKVFVQIVDNCSKDNLRPVIQGKILEGSTIYTDGWKAYDGLILNGYDHYRVYHSHNEFARGKCHVNGIEAFWSFAKRRLAKFNGIAEHKFFLHLKECEFRYNYRQQDLYMILSDLMKKFKIC
jgi:transposase